MSMLDKAIVFDSRLAWYRNQVSWTYLHDANLLPRYPYCDWAESYNSRSCKLQLCRWSCERFVIIISHLGLIDANAISVHVLKKILLCLDSAGQPDPYQCPVICYACLLRYIPGERCPTWHATQNQDDDWYCGEGKLEHHHLKLVSDFYWLIGCVTGVGRCYDSELRNSYAAQPRPAGSRLAPYESYLNWCRQLWNHLCCNRLVFWKKNHPKCLVVCAWCDFVHV